MDGSVSKAEYQTILVSGVQSLLTALNLITSFYPMTSNQLNLAGIVKKNIKPAEKLGFDVKVVVCDINSAHNPILALSSDDVRQRLQKILQAPRLSSFAAVLLATLLLLKAESSPTT